MVDAHTLTDKLTGQVKRLLESVWEHRIDLKDVDEWLGQFAEHDDLSRSERLQMLFLLSQFMYFGEVEVRALLRSLYRDHFRYPFVEAFRSANGNTINRAAIDAAFAEELIQTRFVGVGNPSESSTHLLYFFRQESKLPKNLFMGPGDVFHFVQADEKFFQVVREPDITHYALIDDLCGSGRQVDKYSSDLAEPLRAFAERDGKQVTISYFALFGTTEGLNYVRELGTFDRVECVLELDPSFRCFGEQSRYFANEDTPISRTFAESICYERGARLQPDHPLGYEDSQLLLAFNHNTPDNTLPVFSFDDPTGPPWIPIFRRYPKVEA